MAKGRVVNEQTFKPIIVELTIETPEEYKMLCEIKEEVACRGALDLYDCRTGGFIVSDGQDMLFSGILRALTSDL